MVRYDAFNKHFIVTIKARSAGLKKILSANFCMQCQIFHILIFAAVNCSYSYNVRYVSIFDCHMRARNPFPCLTSYKAIKPAWL